MGCEHELTYALRLIFRLELMCNAESQTCQLCVSVARDLISQAGHAFEHDYKEKSRDARALCITMKLDSQC